MKSKYLSVILSSMCFLSFAAHADDGLSALGEVVSPCAASALNAAAAKAKDADYSNSFTSFGPMALTGKDGDANEAYWVGFTDNSQKKLNFRVTVYCQQGGWKEVRSIAEIK